MSSYTVHSNKSTNHKNLDFVFEYFFNKIGFVLLNLFCISKKCFFLKKTSILSAKIPTFTQRFYCISSPSWTTVPPGVIWPYKLSWQTTVTPYAYAFFVIIINLSVTHAFLTYATVFDSTYLQYRSLCPNSLGVVLLSFLLHTLSALRQSLAPFNSFFQTHSHISAFTPHQRFYVYAPCHFFICATLSTTTCLPAFLFTHLLLACFVTCFVHACILECLFFLLLLLVCIYIYLHLAYLAFFQYFPIIHTFSYLSAARLLFSHLSLTHVQYCIPFLLYLYWIPL